MQAEYRYWFTSKLGLALFGGIGDVAHQFNDFQLNQFKYSVGFGFRFTINSEELLTVRLDFGYGKNSSGFYVEVFEAF